MSTIKVDTITDEAGSGAPDFPNGMTGSAASLTAIPAAQLTGTLPALDGSALTNLTSANLTGALPAIDGSALTGVAGTPAGAVIYHAANTPPTGFIKANGASLSTTTYADLFAVIGYTFGGSGSSFSVPDLRGEFMRGWDDSRGIDSSRAFGSAQVDELKTHNHLEGLRSYSANTGAYGQVATSAGPVSSWTGGTYNRFQFYTSATGGTETRPRNIALLACIKY